ncbi:hypothetical protein L211DRAFT_892473 [Terfezia boudieri ATCC MYA-4762]|uniref:Uncharacterized protein n=1 Tax=Terfezia boudieri ATCC MYA-4762 TaxID=1051890 RepID=A0A3N4LD95_9PEZI|nr:hypothetical protein L211DRAFT_892473 [Terfezia boudieri ATCC MYA-4762]
MPNYNIGERNRPGYRCKSPRELKRLKTEDIDKPRQDAREELGDLGHPPKQHSRQIPQDCIVLTTQESDFQCGGLTVRQLKKRLEQFWDHYSSSSLHSALAYNANISTVNHITAIGAISVVLNFR